MLRVVGTAQLAPQPTSPLTCIYRQGLYMAHRDEKRLFERGVLIVKTKKTKTVEDRAL
jgi:hypothetical protein